MVMGSLYAVHDAGIASAVMRIWEVSLPHIIDPAVYWQRNKT